ncbi:uncharacterized protein si:dkeyp-97a10.2 isoform X2 [Electrophorus electricus]|uniref:uncharacterized protein si:dkeyp-97a10.2 isoform X2 n=1 Tax=Electrophorus electricus TaxID=8005 RepID=UPI0015D0CAA9|nr:uncharacterized protein si:dkeyp-97a10.2 isoform X2 [Electrophorus electricus]
MFFLLTVFEIVNQTMKFLWQHYLVIVWIIAERPLILSCVSVRFPSREPVYVALGRTLVLKAQFEVQPAEKIRLVTWDHKRGSQEVRLVTNNSPHNNRVTVEMDRQQLRLTGVQNSDYGHYTVMVTDDKGNQISASVEVLNVHSPPVASLSLQCTLQTKGAQWDVPSYTWWMDGVEVTNLTANLSADHSTFYLQESLAQNYTCIVNSNQGTSRVECLKVAPDPDHKNWGLIAAVIIETVVIVCFIGYHCMEYLRRRKK